MLYGDHPRQLTVGTYAPNILAILQSSNAYAYCVNDPVAYADASGEIAWEAVAAFMAPCVMDGLITGGVYAATERRFTAGFVNGFVSRITTQAVALAGIFTKSPTGAYVGIIISAPIGSAAGSLAEDMIYHSSDKSMEEIAKSAAQAAATGILSGVASAYVTSAIKIANEAGSAARELMKYNEHLGMGLQLFFDSLVTILSAQEGTSE